MPRHAATFPLALSPRGPGTTAGRWLYAALRAAILDGQLGPGVRLPATRDLARQYQLSRGTVVSAYDQLKAEGYLRAVVGSGTVVNRVLPDDLLTVPAAVKGRARESGSRQPAKPHALSAFGHRVTLFPTSSEKIRAFRANQPALDLVPTTLWAQVAGRRLRRATLQLLMGCPPMGYPPLQEAVAHYLTTSRGVVCSARQVAIVSGVQGALDLAVRLFVDPGDKVVIENPGYTGAARVFRAAGAALAPVHLDDEGLALDDATLTGARLVYVTPAHQFPLGVSMSVARRLALLEWARATNALIFEDDYDSEFRYSGSPVPALQGLDRHGQVLFAGSFSKVLFPSLRLGYLVVPEALVHAVEAALSVTHRHPPVLEQAILADFMVDGHFGRHVRRMREVYAERLGVLIEQGRRHLDGLLEISEIEAGLQTVGWLPNGSGLNARDVVASAARRQVQLTPLSEYWHGRAGRAGFQMGFAAVDPEEIRRGVRELARVLER